MRRIVLLVLFLPFFSLAQTTRNPRYANSTSSYVEISAIELTNNKTIFYMSSYAETEDEFIKRYFKENPDVYRRLSRASSMEQSIYLKRLKEEFQRTDFTISLSPQSYLVDKRNKKYRFISAEGIAVKPDRIHTRPGRTYKFKAIYERVDPGMEVIDYIEDVRVQVGNEHYWNFHDIRINNPARKQPAPEPVPELPPVSTGGYDGNVLEQTKPVKQLKLYGIVYDENTKNPIQAKIVCNLTEYGVLYDSVTTTKSGYYEFMFKPAAYTYIVSAPGYKGKTIDVKLEEIGGLTSFEKDVYLTPEIVQQPEPETKIIVEEKPTSIGDKVENTSEEVETFRLSNVYFQKGRSNILSESYEQLDALANYLKENPTMVIRIEGHTDNAGDAGLNQQLSVDRAYEVRQYLMKKGVSGDRLKFIGYGETRPVSPNDTEENKAKNRRVEYVILSN